MNRKTFNDLRAIYAPTSDLRTGTWATTQECVWNAPRFLKVKYTLYFYEEYSQNTKIKHLFCQILGIGNATWETYVDELKSMQRENQASFDNICGIYKEILRVASSEHWTLVRLEFTSLWFGEMVTYVNQGRI